MEDYLKDPGTKDWFTRLAWLETEWDKVSRDQEVFVCLQAEALMLEMRKAFCCGAWLTVVILAQAAIDAQLAELFEAGQGEGPELNQIRFGPDFVMLRERRNRLMHYEGGVPAVTREDLDTGQEQLEKDARNAVQLVFAAVSGRV